MKPANKPTNQRGTGGSSVSQRTATGSGSRPTSGKFKIESSNPPKSQQIRPTNKIDNT